jgi:hypothetical protein
MIVCDVNERVSVLCRSVCIFGEMFVKKKKREGLVFGPIILLTDVHACAG